MRIKLKVKSQTHMNVVRFVVVLKLQTQSADRSIVSKESLLGDNPYMTCFGHVVQGGISKDNLRIFLAVECAEKRDREKNR